MNQPRAIDPASGTSPPAGGKPRVLAEGRIVLLLATITAAVYLPILWNDFVALDDGKTVYANNALIHLDLSSFSSFWTSPQNNLYAPLTYTMYAGASLLAHGRRDNTPEGYPLSLYAWPFHLCSLILHVLAVMFVYAILRRLIASRWPSAAGALLFSLHPVQVESVAWVTAANGLLCGLLSLCAIYCYLRAILPDETTPDKRSSNGWMILATEAFILALLAKPLAIVTPILAAAVYWMVARQRGCVPRRGHLAPVIWALIAIPFAIVARAAQPIPNWWISVPLWRRPIVAGDAGTFYLCKLLFPLTLVPDYARSPDAIAGHRWFYFAWVVPAAMAIFLARVVKQRGFAPLVGGAVWFVVALLPVLGFATFAFQRLSTVADRYLYLPMFGVALLAAWALSRAAKFRLVTGTVTVAILVSLGTRTVRQIRYWRDTPTLFKHCVEVTGREPGTREN